MMALEGGSMPIEWLTGDSTRSLASSEGEDEEDEGEEGPEASDALEDGTSE